MARNAPLKLPPLVLALVAAGGIWALPGRWALGPPAFPIHRWVALLLSLASLGFVVSSVSSLRGRRSTLSPSDLGGTSALVQSGPFRLGATRCTFRWL